MVALPDWFRHFCFSASPFKVFCFVVQETRSNFFFSLFISSLYFFQRGLMKFLVFVFDLFLRSRRKVCSVSYHTVSNFKHSNIHRRHKNGWNRYWLRGHNEHRFAVLLPVRYCRSPSTLLFYQNKHSTDLNHASTLHCNFSWAENEFNSRTPICFGSFEHNCRLSNKTKKIYRTSH